MNTANKVIDAALRFYTDTVRDTKGRYRSWEHCYKVFHDARMKRQRGESPDYDYLSLHLAFYLASWGMYRGSSFLLQQDYTVHEDVVVEILHEEYDLLQGIECEELRKEAAQELLLKLKKKLQNIYGCKRVKVVSLYKKNKPGKNNPKTDISDILISKILMGTLGCTPAYDNYFVKAVRGCHVASGRLGKGSMKDLSRFYELNKFQFDAVRVGMKIPHTKLVYPPMKFLDMGFWQIGTDNDDKIRRTLNRQ